jgi:hypothetical protein
LFEGTSIIHFMEAHTDNPLAAELTQMAETDQQMRLKAMKNETAWDSTVDEQNTERLKDIIRKTGWPTVPKVGQEASQAAWLLVQHATELEFMKECLSLMKLSAPGELNPANVAYLEDRVLMMDGKPQIYGTQFRDVGEGMKVYPIEDVENVNVRRSGVGLGTLEEYEARLREMYSN